jgi:phosphoglycolate phosphatase
VSGAASWYVVEAVAFDLDGTLLDTIHDLSAAVNRLLGETGAAPLPKAAVRDLVGKGMANLVGRAWAVARGHAPQPEELAALLARYQAIYAEQLGRETTLYPGVLEGLARLHDAGIPLAVVTNKASRFVAPHLEHAGIAHFFAIAIGGDDAQAKKPDAAPLRLAAQRLGIQTARLLMVGDSGNDALAARAAGCPVVILPYGYNEGLPVAALDADGIVASIAEVAERVVRAPVAEEAGR